MLQHRRLFNTKEEQLAAKHSKGIGQADQLLGKAQESDWSLHMRGAASPSLVFFVSGR